MRSILFYTFLFLVSYGAVAQAQTAPMVPNGGASGIPQLEEQVSYDLLPLRPNQGDTVEIEAKMFGTPVKNAIFTWTVDGKLYKREQGLNKISVYVNKNTKVNLTILTVAGTTITKQWVFNPQNVVLYWETNTYTPPFYKGKSLYSAESALTFHAINLDAKNPLTNTYANYVWKKDGVVQGNDSGVRKNTFTYQGDILQYEPLFELLYSNVTSYDQAKAGQTSAPVSTRAVLRVQTFLSEIFTYEKTPLLGVLFNKKIGITFPVTKPEVTLVTYPTYFSTVSALIPDYIWSVNESVIKRDSNVLSFKKTKDNEQSRLTIRVSNPSSLLQSRNITHIVDTTTKVDAGLFGGFGK
ncbi:MAG: hypothetical protein V4686_02070 [Patescibacteria group bacterium]